MNNGKFYVLKSGEICIYTCRGLRTMYAGEEVSMDEVAEGPFDTYEEAIETPGTVDIEVNRYEAELLIPILSILEGDELKDVLGQLHEAYPSIPLYPTGTLIYKEGTPCGDLWF